MAEFLDHRGDAELLEGEDLRRDETEDASIAVGMHEKVAAEARLFIHLVAEVEIAPFLVALPAVHPADLVHHVSHLVASENLVSNWHDFAVAAYLGRLAFTEV